LLVEIYPRLLTGEVVKSDHASRRAYVDRDSWIPLDLTEHAAATEDMFDAAISALGLAEHQEELMALKRQPEYALEGAIWRPGRCAE
jgi:hypothetical protein